MNPANSKSQQFVLIPSFKPFIEFSQILTVSFIQGKAFANAASTVTAFAMLIGCAHLPLWNPANKKIPQLCLSKSSLDFFLLYLSLLFYRRKCEKLTYMKYHSNGNAMGV